MTTSGFIFRNALRNKRRALLSVLSVAVSLFLFVTLLVALREMTVPIEDIGAASRIIVRNKISLGNALPARQLQTIQKIPGIEAVTPFTWFGGKLRGEDVMMAQFAINPGAVSSLLMDAKMPKEDFERFFADQRTAIIGKDSATKYNIKKGDKIVLEGTFYPYDLELDIAGIYEGTIDNRNMFFHHKYLDELTGGGQVGTWWIKAADINDVGRLVTTINKAFENTAAEVRAETERAFQLSFVSMWGNIKLLVHRICSVVVFTLLLVSTSTMSMAVRERFRELAVLKALGYQRRELFAFILAESFALAVSGAILGVGAAYCLFTFSDISKMTNGIFVVLEVTPRVMAQAFLVAAGLGILSALGPAYSVARMSVVQGLKTLD